MDSLFVWNSLQDDLLFWKSQRGLGLHGLWKSPVRLALAEDSRLDSPSSRRTTRLLWVLTVVNVTPSCQCFAEYVVLSSFDLFTAYIYRTARTGPFSPVLR